MLVPLTLLEEPLNPLRAVRADAVAALAASMVRIGLRTPVAVRACRAFRSGSPVDAWEIVAGRHRVAAARKLGWSEIDAIDVGADEVAARLWEIAENLHRAELTVAERAEHIAEWVRLTGEKQKEESAQVAPKLSSRGRSGEGRPESGINAAVRELGIDRTEAQRAVKIASLAPEAKEAAREAKLDDNQTVLLSAAREPTANAQVAHVELEARKRQEAALAREEARRRLHEQEEAHKLNKQQDTAIRLTVEQEFAGWLLRHTPATEIDTVISWLQVVKNAGVIAALRREAA